MKTLDDLLKGKQIIAVVCNQYGDTGKGKFSDYFSATWADVIARGTGGANAGHTVVIDGKERVFHLIPAGIAYDKEGKINILGNGMVIHVPTLLHEMAELRKDGGTYNNLMVSLDAYVVLPCHLEEDQAKNVSQAKGGVGSTGRGITPTYVSKIARHGIKIRDLYNKDVLRKKLLKLQAEEYPDQTWSIDGLISALTEDGQLIKEFAKDTKAYMLAAIEEGKKICLEGAQGLLLSVEHGVPPFVTSSDCSVNGTATGVGICAGAIDIAFGVMKFPYMTRVGAGPFPTEFGGHESEVYCADVKHNKLFELEEAGVPYTIGPDGKPRYDLDHPRIRDLMNSKDARQQGVGMRLRGNEYGATTGRARRTGWVDAVAGKYAVGCNHSKGRMKLILTKVDVATDLDKFNVCTEYKDPAGGARPFTCDPDALQQMQPVYQSFDGWSTPIMGERRYDRLPSSLRSSIKLFEKLVHGRAVIVSTGPDQKDTIVR